MLRYLFATLFLLSVCSTSFAVAHNAGSEDPGSATVQSVEIFNDNCKIKLKADGGDNNDADNKIQNIDGVFFVSVGNLLVAVAEAKYTQTGGGSDAYNFVAAYPENNR